MMSPERLAELRKTARDFLAATMPVKTNGHPYSTSVRRARGLAAMIIEQSDEIERLRAENEKANERANRWEMTHDEAIDVMQSHLDRVCGERDAALARVKKLESTIQLERRMRDNLLGLMWHESSREFRLCEEAMYRLPPGLLAIAKDALKGGAE